jgi:hypothetical protein
MSITAGFEQTDGESGGGDYQFCSNNTKDLHIIVIKKKSLTIQTARF